MMEMDFNLETSCRFFQVFALVSEKKSVQKLILTNFLAGVRFVNHEYDYRQNWTTRSPITK